MVKTTVRVSDTLWQEVRHRAIDEGVTVQELIERALKAYLKTPLKREKGGTR